jgi:ATP-dependent DNA helicase DinG
VTSLSSAVTAALGPGGALSRHSPGLQPRPGQRDMALAVAHAIENGEHLAVEAGTGTGKTLAYLVPLLLSGRRALLSTATQALQDQLFLRDIPAVVQALGLPVRVALLKGRSSYVCVQRLEQASQGGAARGDPALAAALEQVHRWARQSLRGDLAELPGLDGHASLRPLISSTRENCLGASCPQSAHCHLNRARQDAQAADWVVINHHLLVADQQGQPDGADALLPAVDVVVIDEAHQLRDTAVQLLGHALGSRDLLALARDLAAVGPLRARGLAPWAPLALVMEQAVQAIAGLIRVAGAGQRRLRWVAGAPQGLASTRWAGAASAVAQALDAARRALALTADAAVELAHLHARAHRLQQDWIVLVQPLAPEGGESCASPGEDLRWLEWEGGDRSVQGWRLVGAPLEASSWMAVLMHSPPQSPAQSPAQSFLQEPTHASAPQSRSWVFTSATLGTDDALSWFTRPLGLDRLPALRTLRIPSPFDHAAQAALYVPDDVPEPVHPDHTPVLAQKVAHWASSLGGRTLVLTTTLKAARVMAESLRRRLAQQPGPRLEVLEAGPLSRRAALARFRAAGADPGHPGAVLVASMAFWEGVDLAGDVLQLLVIDKLPFPPPDDPLIEHRVRQSEAAGLRGFDAVHLPEAAQALKQGAGRLIRSETDRGVLVVGDRRLLTRAYAERLLAALPPMQRLMDEADMAAALQALVLTRASTKGLLRS